MSKKKGEIIETMAVGDYVTISLMMNKDTGTEIIWWVIDVLGEKIEIRDQDYCDLRDQMKYIDENKGIYMEKISNYYECGITFKCNIKNIILDSNDEIKN